MANELERKMVELQLLREQLEQYEKQAVMLMEHANDLQVTKSALENLKSVEKANEILLPLGAGIYGKAALGDVKSVTVGVGGGIFIDKSLKDAEAFVEDKMSKVEESSSQVSIQMQLISNALEKLNNEMQQMSKK